MTSLARGTYVERSAVLAWATARFLLAQGADPVRGTLADLARIRLEEGIERFPDGSWRTRPNWEIPPQRQLEVLRARFGPDFLERLSAALRER